MRLSVLDLAVDSIGEESTSSTCGIQVGHSQHLSWVSGESHSVVINRGQDVVTSGGVEDALLSHVVVTIKGITSGGNCVDDGGDICTVGSHNITVLDESCADVASVVCLNSQDTCSKQDSVNRAIMTPAELQAAVNTVWCAQAGQEVFQAET